MSWCCVYDSYAMCMCIGVNVWEKTNKIKLEINGSSIVWIKNQTKLKKIELVQFSVLSK
jgi:hypothetical protein